MNIVNPWEPWYKEAVKFTNDRIEKIDRQLAIYKGATDDYSKQIYRSLLMEKRWLITWQTPGQTELFEAVPELDLGVHESGEWIYDETNDFYD